MEGSLALCGLVVNPMWRPEHAQWHSCCGGLRDVYQRRCGPEEMRYVSIPNRPSWAGRRFDRVRGRPDRIGSRDIQRRDKRDRDEPPPLHLAQRQPIPEKQPFQGAGEGPQKTSQAGVGWQHCAGDTLSTSSAAPPTSDPRDRSNSCASPKCSGECLLQARASCTSDGQGTLLVMWRACLPHPGGRRKGRV